MSHKIAAIGDVNGQFTSLFSKIGELHKKHDFAFVIICGCLFADQTTATEGDQAELAKLLAGGVEIPVQTYFTLGRRALPSAVVHQLSTEDAAGDVCENLTFLGRKTSIKTSDGFKLVSVGGTFRAADPGESISDFQPTYGDRDATVAKGYNSADILVTNDWPAEVRRGSTAFFGGVNPDGSQKLAELCTALKPRYHFSASEHAFVREPFFHDGPTPRQLTSFVSLAAFGNTSKQKWVFAFELEPSAPAPAQLPPNATASPFFSHKRKRGGEDSSNGAFSRFRNSEKNNKRHRGPRPPPGPDQCFFCLSNPACEQHMVTSVADESYMTIAKGPLSTPETFPSLKGLRCHMLLIPLAHSPTLQSIPDPTSRNKATTELQNFREGLHRMLATKSLDPTTHKPTLGAITWQIARSGGIHYHLQFLPLPQALITSDLITKAFTVEAENLSLPYPVTSPTAMAEIEAESDYFKAQIFNSESGEEKALVVPIDGGVRFDLQFGRRVVGKLLGLERRVVWKHNAQGEGEEAREAEEFKAVFGGWDFTQPGFVEAEEGKKVQAVTEAEKMGE